jgi:hypothetical protein
MILLVVLAVFWFVFMELNQNYWPGRVASLLLFVIFGWLLAKNGNAAQTSEDGSEGPEEPFFLHEEITLHTMGTNIELPDEEIPVAGVRSQAENTLLGQLFRYFISKPHVFVQEPVTKSFPHDLCADLVDDFLSLCRELVNQIFIILLRAHTWFWVGHALKILRT